MTLLLEQEPWMERAACRDSDHDLFFPNPHASVGENQERIRRAKAVCARCPVEGDCLDYALRTMPTLNENWGIWGGTTEAERVQMLRRRRNGGPLALPERDCRWCGESFRPHHGSSAYCCDDCRRLRKNARRRVLRGAG